LRRFCRSITLWGVSLGTAVLTAREALPVSVAEFPLPTPASYPVGIAVGPDGAIWFTESSYFADTGRNKIGRITKDGVVTEFSIPTSDSGPFGIVAGPDGALWFTESLSSKIGRMTTAGGITEFPLSPGAFPLGICLGRDGALWFCEKAADKIGRITTAGVITEFPLPAGTAPFMITSGPEGTLWFTEFFGIKLGRMTTDGVVAEFALPGLFPAAYRITSGPDGNVWFTEFNNRAIGRISSVGDITEFPLPPGASQPFGICAGPDGALWFTENGDPSRIGRITTLGVISEFSIPTTSGLPEDICPGPEGDLFFGETLGNNIGRVSLALAFSVLPPCRIVDTRRAAGPLGGPSLAPNAGRDFPFAGACGIPPGALAVSGTVAVVASPAAGDLRAYAADQPMPPTSVINFGAGKTRANSLLVQLSTDGSQSVRIQNDSAGAVDVLFDVSGYFK
jgi:virginiamycin B lyase